MPMPEVAQTDLHGRNREVIQGAVFKRGFIRGQHVCLALTDAKYTVAAGKPWTLHFGEGCFVNEECADARGYPNIL